MPKRIIFHPSDSEIDDDGEQAPLEFGIPTVSNSKSHQNGVSDKQRRERSEALALAQRQLPIYTGKDAIINETWNNETVVILGETGCGKTTQIPQYLMGVEYQKLSRGSRPIKIVVTQPRRVAAISLATRVSEEVGCRLGSTVGYTVRFDDCSGPQTRLKYVTDGTLLQEMLSDRILERHPKKATKYGCRLPTFLEK